MYFLDINFNLKTYENITLSELKDVLSDGFYSNIIFVKKGTLIYSHENEEYTAGEKQVIVIPPFSDLSLKESHKKDLNICVFSYFMNSDFMPIPQFPVPVVFDASSPVSSDLESFFCMEEKDYRDSLLKKSLEYKILHFSESTKNTGEECINSKMQPLLTFIQKNLSSNFSVGDMAKECNISEASVYKIFESYMKIPPKQYIRNQRMKYALYLLLNTDIPISEISYKAGFYDQYYFSKEFKKIFSLSPSTYRKTHQKY